LVFKSAFKLYFGWRAWNAGRVPGEGPCILAANHASYADPPLVGCGVSRHVSMLARDSLFRFPVFGALLRSWGAVPVDPAGGSVAGLKGILDRLQEGRAVLIFPEGTRTSDGELMAGRSGVGLLVVRSNAPVVPVRIWGSYQAYGRRHLIPRPVSIRVKYGHPMMFESLRAEAAGCGKARLKAIYREISGELMRRVAALEPCEDMEQFG
jgi:1-acyl-sn-glycerol-3-phosphate acyltransferase